MITGLGHTGLVVRDMERMIDFYRDAFGFQVIIDTAVSGQEADRIVDFHVEHERIVLMQLQNSQIELLEYRPLGRDYPEDYKSNDLFGVHLALQTNDMEGDFAMLKAKGVKIFREIKTIAAEKIRVFLIHDPEGHVVEIQSGLE